MQTKHSGPWGKESLNFCEEIDVNFNYKDQITDRENSGK